MFKGFKKGKKDAIYDSKIPMLAKYMVDKVPDVESVDYLSDITIPLGMMMNDTLGCCTLAGVAHLVMGYSSLLKTDIQLQFMTDQEVETYYEILGHYNPKDPSTDGGCLMTDVLNYWMNTGIRVGTVLNKIDGYAYLDPTNIGMIRYALSTFGGLYAGIQLPQYCETTDYWQVTPNMGPILGGHCITIQGMDDQNFYGVSWGKKITYSQQFISTYCDELYCLVDEHFVNPQGLTMETLMIDMNKIKNKSLV